MRGTACVLSAKAHRALCQGSISCGVTEAVRPWLLSHAKPNEFGGPPE